MKIRFLFLICVSVANIYQIDAIFYDLKCKSHLLKPKPLPWSKPIFISKYDEPVDLCGKTKVYCEPAKLLKLSGKLVKEDAICDDCHKSGDCLYEFCKDCKDFVKDKLYDLKHCVVKDICKKLQDKVIFESKLKKSYHEPPPPPAYCYTPCEERPCDPVSYAIAYKAHCKPVPECKLQYGQCKKPYEEHPPEHRCIPEERLYKVEKHIIELKPKPYKYDCEDESEEECDYKPPQPPCYKDCGYRKVEPKYCKYIPCSKGSAEDCTPKICSLRPPPICKTLLPGRVVYAKCEEPKKPYYHDDDCSYEDKKHPIPVLYKYD